MRASWALLTVFVIVSGCIIPPPQVIQRAPVEAQEITTTTTSTTTTTTHKVVDIMPLNGLKSTTSTAPSTTSTSTSTTTSTTTTVTLQLRMREYVPYGNMTFYLTGVEPVKGADIYVMDYTTNDGQRGRATFTNTTLIDDLELGVARASEQMAVSLFVRQNQRLKDRTPADSTILTLGAGLTNRSFGGYRIYMNSVQSDKVKLSFDDGQNATLVELAKGDVAYYNDLEIGVLETRIPGSLAAIYLLKDAETYEGNGGQRYCLRKFVRYPDATSLIIDGQSNATYGGASLMVYGIGDGIVTLMLSEDGTRQILPLSCGGTLDVSGARYNLIWYGGSREGCAKIVAHS